MDWSQLRTELLSRMDIRSTYESIGVQFAADEPTPRGWLRCHAIGREDNTPSAAINVESGFYRDLGKDGDALSLWDALARFGKFADWKQAFKHYAKEHGLAKRLPKKDREEPGDKVDIVTWNPLSIRGLLNKYPQFDEWSVRAAGGQLAKYPAKHHDPTYCVSWPVYGPHLLNAPPVGFVCQAADGADIDLFQGGGVPDKPTKRVNVGGSKAGLVGRYGVKLLAGKKKKLTDPDVEYVIKVEGISDLIALQAAIPRELRKSIAVITNSAGCSDTKTPADAAPVLAGHNVVIIHDSDKPGQDGAKLWLGMVGKGCKSIRNVVLHPEDIEENHGKDLRDWLSGNSFNDLAALIEQTEPFAAQSDELSSQTLTPYQAILARLGIVVLGHIGTTNRIAFFTESDGRNWEISDLSRYKPEALIMHIGSDKFEECVNTTAEPDPAKLSMAQIRRAIGAQANVRRITDDKKLGEGAWEVSGRLALVGAGEALIWNGGLKRLSKPFFEDCVFDFSEEPWYDTEWMMKHIEIASSREWCKEQVVECAELFARWDNWKIPDSPDLLAALVCCTWIQTVWPIRPLVSVSGPTNSGKTVFLENTLAPLFGNLALNISKPTEAGLRQFVGHTSRALIVDEFEHDKHRSHILELFRTSSRGQEVVRGTANQKGMRFGLKHIPWVGGIELGLTEAADANRFICFDLKKRLPGSPSNLSIPPREELGDLGLRLLIVAMRHYRTAMQYLYPLRSEKWKAHDSRLVEIYSVPVALLSAVLGSDYDGARAMLDKVLSDRQSETSVEADEAILLEQIYSADVQTGKASERDTVGNLIGGGADFGANTTLERYGIRVNRADIESSPASLFIAPRVVRSKLLRGTPASERDIGQILLRIDGAKRIRSRLSGTHTRGVEIPLASVAALFELDDASTGGRIF